MHTLQIPDTSSHTIVGHAKVPHTLIGMGSAALAAAVLYPGKVSKSVSKYLDALSPVSQYGYIMANLARLEAPEIPARDNEV